jgi:hypothetical protein
MDAVANRSIRMRAPVHAGTQNSLTHKHHAININVAFFSFLAHALPDDDD